MTTRLITPDELLEAPTGFDWGSVAESAGATTGTQTAELNRIIDRASNWASRYVYNSQDARLCASTDTETARIAPGVTKAWVDNTGWLWFRTAFFPILSITQAQWALAPAGTQFSTIQYNALTTANLLDYGEGTRKRRIVDFSQDWTFLRMGALVNFIYVNGWPNAVLTAPITAGANVNVPIDDSTGFTATPGTPQIGKVATIFDADKTEQVTVTAVPDATHVTLASVANAHAAGVGLSAVPPEMKWAVVLACLHFARIRGTDAATFVDDASAHTTSLKEESDALFEAEALLDDFRVRS